MKIEQLEPRALLAVDVASYGQSIAGLKDGYAVVEADFDGDGRLDVVSRVYGQTDAGFRLFLNRGSAPADGIGTIAFEQGPELPLARQESRAIGRTQLITGRFDGDETIDLLVVNPLPDSANGGRGGIRVRLLKGDGEGGFRACPQGTSEISLGSYGHVLSTALDGADLRESVLVVSAQARHDVQDREWWEDRRGAGCVYGGSCEYHGGPGCGYRR